MLTAGSRVSGREASGASGAAAPASSSRRRRCSRGGQLVAAEQAPANLAAAAGRSVRRAACRPPRLCSVVPCLDQSCGAPARASYGRGPKCGEGAWTCGPSAAKRPGDLPHFAGLLAIYSTRLREFATLANGGRKGPTSSTLSTCVAHSVVDGDSQVVDSRLSDPGDAVRRRRAAAPATAGSPPTSATTRGRSTSASGVARSRAVRSRQAPRGPRAGRDQAAGRARAARGGGRPDRRRVARAGRQPSVDEVGELALRGLRELDPVAYVRFASVYRKFGDIEEFEASWSGSRPSRRCSASTCSSRVPRLPASGGVLRTRRQANRLPPEPGKTPARRPLAGSSTREISDSRRGS